MIKLYRSAMHPKQWIAYVEGSGWVIFPAGENGWESRQAARGLDPMYLRQVPVSLAESAGLPEAEFCDVA